MVIHGLVCQMSLKKRGRFFRASSLSFRVTGADLALAGFLFMFRWEKSIHAI
jgi:hypothetical protein